MIQLKSIRDKTFILFNDSEEIGKFRFGHRPKDNKAFLHSFNINEKFRRRQYGTILLKIAIDICERNKKESLDLYVNKKNLPAISFYKKNGFNEYFDSSTVIGMRKKFD